jgi:hypothetical protein
MYPVWQWVRNNQNSEIWNCISKQLTICPRVLMCSVFLQCDLPAHSPQLVTMWTNQHTVLSSSRCDLPAHSPQLLTMWLTSTQSLARHDVTYQHTVLSSSSRPTTSDAVSLRDALLCSLTRAWTSPIFCWYRCTQPSYSVLTSLMHGACIRNSARYTHTHSPSELYSKSRLTGYMPQECGWTRLWWRSGVMSRGCSLSSGHSLTPRL